MSNNSFEFDFDLVREAKEGVQQQQISADAYDLRECFYLTERGPSVFVKCCAYST